jgi:predicted nucleic acid-binding protein
MPAFVLDASVALAWCFPADPAEDTPYSRKILRLLESNEAVVPEIWAFEIANVLFVAFAKRARITEPQIHEYLETLKALPIRVESQDLWENVGLQRQARVWDLPAYDAAYLALALRANLPLATADEDLRKAALGLNVQVL